MSTLVAVPITASERALGLVSHYRRSDAAPEEEARQCEVAGCGCRVSSFGGKRKKRCSAHAKGTTGSMEREGYW